ncbi:glycosyltransferase [Streptomyces sioyaensis]|uniref:glycosyltransferase n=1 Tax=Streptomyces sioyaensis TaxID=67364 RepID=UPI0037D8CFDE
MRTLIVAAGTMGDVAPYTGLGRRLQEAGYRVAIATHERFEALVRSCGLDYRSIPGDPEQWARAVRDHVGLHGGGLRTKLAVARLAPPLLAECGQGVLEAARQGADVLLCSQGVMPLVYSVGKSLGLPSMGVFLAPVMPSRYFPPLGLSQRSLGPWANHVTGHGMMYTTMRLHRAAISELGLKDLKERDRRYLLTRWPVWHGFSRHVVPRPPDWRAGLEVAGYWWPTPPRQWQPPQELVEFIENGPPPVFVGFGSMGPSAKRSERLAAMAVAAVRQAGMRGVIQGGWAGLRGKGDDILSVGEVSHEWLFPRTAAVVHHAGAGTSAAGLRAGVPAVPVPLLFDMHFWASRLVALGVAPTMVPFSKINAKRLALAVSEAVHNPRHRARARALSHRIAEEDGAAPVIEAVGRIAGSDLP